MRIPGLVMIAAFALSGCGDAQDGGSPPVRHGRYTGIGTYPVDGLWSRMAAAPRPADRAAARVEDDSQIVVVVDSVTGEVRQCGNMSGACIAMNPWKATAAGAPVPLTAHASDVARETEEDAAGDPVVNGAETSNP